MARLTAPVRAENWLKGTGEKHDIERAHFVRYSVNHVDAAVAEDGTTPLQSSAGGRCGTEPWVRCPIVCPAAP